MQNYSKITSIYIKNIYIYIIYIIYINNIHIYINDQWYTYMTDVETSKMIVFYFLPITYHIIDLIIGEEFIIDTMVSKDYSRQIGTWSS